MKLDNLKTISELVEMYPNLYTENRLKHMIRMREHNGLSEAVYIIAGKAHIDVPALEKAIAERNAA